MTRPNLTVRPFLFGRIFELVHGENAVYDQDVWGKIAAASDDIMRLLRAGIIVPNTIDKCRFIS